MKGLMLIAIPIDTERGDPAVAMRACLEAGRGIGNLEPKERGQGPQVVVKQFHEGESGSLPEGFAEHPDRWVLAKDAALLDGLGFDARGIGVDVILMTPEPGKPGLVAVE